MSSDQKRLPMPFVLVDYQGVVCVQIKYDDICICSKQGCVEIELPQLDVEPLVLLQTINNGGRPVGPEWAYDYDKGDWVTYDEDKHLVPGSSALVDVGTEPRQLDLSADTGVELISKASSVDDSPHDEAEDELDEPF